MFRIAKKELKIFFTDKRALLLSFALPVALISLFALAFGGMDKHSEPKEISLLVSDLDSTQESRNAIALLDSEKNLRTIPVPLAEAQQAVKKGKENAVLVIGKGFSDSLRSGNKLPMELQYDEAKEPEVGMLQQSLIPNLFRLNGAQGMKKKLVKQVEVKDTARLEGFYDSISALISSYYEKHADTTAEDSATAEQNGFGNFMSGIEMKKIVEQKEEVGPGLVQAVAGTTVMMLLFSMAAMGAGLLTEKEEGTLRKLLVSPIHPNQILFGKMLAANAVSTVQLIIMMIYSYFVFKLNIFQNVPALLLLIFATVFACSSFGIFLASIAKTRQQVDVMSRFIILAISAIGGSMIPSFIMPEWMQKISVIAVNYWSIQGFYDIFWRQLPLSDPTFLSRIGVLLGMGIVLTVISLRFFRKNILKMF
ncbi:MAG: ABC transporter permease [Bacteroidetes bacterium]|nr:ABC transporter permease [Bacteroidota bacterium]